MVHEFDKAPLKLKLKANFIIVLKVD